MRYIRIMENIHNESYSIMLDSIIQDPEEKKLLFNSIKTVPSIKKIGDWALKWVDSNENFGYRVIAFALMEGLFFSGAFASIFWFKTYVCKSKTLMKGFVKSNEFIARDEGLHYQSAVMIYNLLQNKIENNKIISLVKEAVSISKEFVQEAIPTKLIGINENMMNHYIEYIADRILVDFGCNKLFNNTNPFDFMEAIGMTNKTNFFEQRVSEYSNGSVISDHNLLNSLNDNNIDF